MLLIMASKGTDSIIVFKLSRGERAGLTSVVYLLAKVVANHEGPDSRGAASDPAALKSRSPLLLCILCAQPRLKATAGRIIGWFFISSLADVILFDFLCMAQFSLFAGYRAIFSISVSIPGVIAYG